MSSQSPLHLLPSLAALILDALGVGRNPYSVLPLSIVTCFYFQNNSNSIHSVHRASLPSNNLTGKFRTNPLAPFNGSYNLDSFAPAPKSIFDDHKPVMKDEDRMSTPDIKGYINMTEPDDKFPTSLQARRDSDILSANHDALRISNGRTPGPDHFNPQSRRTRSTHQSMPQNFGPARFDNVEESYERIVPRHQAHQQPHHQPHRSLESSFNFPIEHSGSMTPVGRPVSLQSSYSTNDVPTMSAMGYDSAITPPHTRSGSFHQHNASMGHQHNASMGRIPGNVSQPHSSRNSPESVNGNHQAGQNMLQPSALAYGPQQYASVSGNSGIPGLVSHVSHGNAQYQPYPNAFATGASYGQGGQQIAYVAPVPYQQNHASFQPASYQVAPRVGPTPRRGVDGADSPHQNRYNNTPIEQHIGQIYAMCKDQFGCRYLQRKLEEHDPSVLKIIFNETCAHVNELMIDPFGNYLCQKLLEFSNNDQRTLLINNAASQLVEIALNQHGTRALQKMIEYISTQEQIRTVIYALRDSVVELVQDLNGNHVIQKCLTRLKGDNAEFIYEAVGSFCVKVGTHRHGCCVIQRCIDHASDDQKKRLIAQITSNSIALVQDPYGNYVVQYILDLGETYFTTRMCYTFYGKIALLSKQKFSSNVMEKCLRMADPIVRNEMIQEMFKNNELEKMLRDSFANYVVQTAMEYAEENTRARLHAAIREKLPLIRNTPHGRRIATKLTAFENAHAAMNHRNLAYQSEMAIAMQTAGTETQAGAPTTACYQAVTPEGESRAEDSSNSTGGSEQSQDRVNNFTPRRDRSPSNPVNSEGMAQISNQLDRFHIPSFPVQNGPSDGYSVEHSPQGGQTHL